MSVPLIFELNEPAVCCSHIPESDLPDDVPGFPDDIRRKTLDLPQVAEPEVMRHFVNLSTMNHHVDKGFYPLGSCTMKYNPKVNEDLARLPGFANLHPHQPVSTLQGALELMWMLEQWLCEITGLAAITLQPAAGSHGELTGMFLVRTYHLARNDLRTRVLIPDSSHGTNPASIVMAGFEPVSIPSDKRGRIDINALRRALSSDIAALMVTNPNTLGLFEDRIDEVADAVHEAGALLYMDGANMNALTGLARPGDMGFDIVHLNLHKTFSTPHGGGGPGSGPVAVTAELEKFLPVPRIKKNAPLFNSPPAEREGGYVNSPPPLIPPRKPGGETPSLPPPRFAGGELKGGAHNCIFDWDWDHPDSIGQVHTFYGNFGVLVKAAAYIRALGAVGLKRVSETAILNANYLRARLIDLYKLPYDDLCMHEVVFSADNQCVNGVKGLDIAKRLLDFGYHAPTVYFPLIVHEALMMEPTETETVATLDGFIEVMKQIDKEANESPEVLKNAPVLTPVKRLDEVRAVKMLDVCFRP